jgi:phosphate acetyltransferase
MSYPSVNYPQIAGLLLTGKQNPATQVINLIAGLGDTPFTVSKRRFEKTPGPIAITD